VEGVIRLSAAASEDVVCAGDTAAVDEEEEDGGEEDKASREGREKEKEEGEEGGRNGQLRAWSVRRQRKERWKGRDVPESGDPPDDPSGPFRHAWSFSVLLRRLLFDRLRSSSSSSSCFLLLLFPRPLDTSILSSYRKGVQRVECGKIGELGVLHFQPNPESNRYLQPSSSSTFPLLSSTPLSLSRKRKAEITYLPLNTLI
jgi:hypothetical protein